MSVLTAPSSPPSLAARKDRIMVDANDWLTKHRAGHFVPDRVCGGLADEKLVPGDVDDQGNAHTLTGITYFGGSEYVWMNLQQAKRAEYYGWRWTSNLIGRDPATGDAIYAMARPAA